MSVAATTFPMLRIGEVARLVQTTPRTIRYYEEIGLLPESADRGHGRHRRLRDRKSTRLNSSHTVISYAVFCLKKKKLNSKFPHQSLAASSLPRLHINLS